MRSFATVLFATVYTIWQYVAVGLPRCDCLPYVEQIATGVSEPPLSYRILIPKLLYALGNTENVLVLFQIVMLLVFFSLVLIANRRVGWSSIALVMTLLVILTIMMPTSYFSVYMIFEWNLYLCVLLLLPRWSYSPR